MLFIVELSVIFFSTLIFSTLNTTLNSTLDTLVRGVRPFNQLILLKSIEINGSICKLLSIEIWSKLDF